jgi:phosphoserine / homoserine phosphotransferase
MLMAAHAGFFIHPPEAITRQFPQFPVMHNYPELRAAFDGAGQRLLTGAS